MVPVFVSLYDLASFCDIDILSPTYMALQSVISIYYKYITIVACTDFKKTSIAGAPRPV